MVTFNMLTTMLIVLVGTVNADIYMQMPRGSNNRLDGKDRERKNANRLFDSQNNDRGGYNVGRDTAITIDDTGREKKVPVGEMTYYVDSRLTVSWINQHECGGSNAKCDIILQYMCDPNLRDGTTTDTIPERDSKCPSDDCNSEAAKKFGQHEPASSYNMCRLTQRNKGLFTADQELKGDSAKYTRQNPNGQRRGLECPEERDYYPYWRPSPWVDIAIMTSDTSNCEQLQENSFNVKAREICYPRNKEKYFGDMAKKSNPDDDELMPSSKEECEKINFKGTDINKFTWTKVPPNGATKPECLAAPKSRDNHLGNGAEAANFANYYNWTIPEVANGQACALRIRYNISTGDFPPASTDASNNTVHMCPETHPHAYFNGKHCCKTDREKVYTPQGEKCDGSKISLSSLCCQGDKHVRCDHKNCVSYDPKDNGTPKLDIGSEYGLDNPDEAKDRGYYLKNNPEIKPLKVNGNVKKLNLELAIDTAQIGRVFEDRSHKFKILPRPAQVPAGKRIHNLNVRGKRGNIVQVFPATEYDFHPNDLHVKKGDYIHMQWTGSNRNPDNNDGEGKKGTDRSNAILLRRKNYPEGTGRNMFQAKDKLGHLGNNYPGKIRANNSFLSLGSLLTKKAAILVPELIGVKDGPGASAVPDEESDDLDVKDEPGETVTTNRDAENDELDEVASLEEILDEEELTAEVDERDGASLKKDAISGRRRRRRRRRRRISTARRRISSTTIAQQNQARKEKTQRNLKRKLRLSQLNDAPAYFDLGPVEVKKCLTYLYMCTRNNNFSNRSQKGKVVVDC